MIKNRAPEAEQCAAIEIQRFVRGCRVRQKIIALIEKLLREIRAKKDPSETPDSDVPDARTGQKKAKKISKSSQQSGTQGDKKGGQGVEKLSELQDIGEVEQAEKLHDWKRREKEARKAGEQLLQGLRKRSRGRKAQEIAVRREIVESGLKTEEERPVKRDIRDFSRKPPLPGPSFDSGVPVKKQKMTKKSASRLALEASYDRYVQKGLGKEVTSTNMLQFVDYCAHKIQVWWLMKHHRFLRERFIQRFIDLKKKATLKSVAALEAMILETSKSGDKKKQLPTESEAAVSIQRAWRRHIDIQVYQYYRDLINFKTRGNPSVMLRCINPNEAKLLDPASGTSVRFRLAGERFPPNIYYKIFTHRPIQDMCANSPKDYTKSQTKQLSVRHQHNNAADIPPQQDDKEGWYERFENNGWRLVSDRMIHYVMNDPISWESSKKTYHFDHSKLKRKQDVERQKKAKKIEWMQKMYKQGMLHARANDQNTVQLIEGATAGMMATVDNQGPDALEDWEVDELLDWTTSLNFEEYFSTWKDLATSAAADNQLEKTVSLGTTKSDPYELTVSTAPSRFQSTRQSHRTTATLTSGSIHMKT